MEKILNRSDPEDPVVNKVRGWAPTCSAATSTETRSRGGTEHVLDMRISCFVMV